MGATKTILIGYEILYPALFHAIGESVPKKDFSFQGKTRASVPKSAFEINIKANAEMRKKITNFVLEMFIHSELYRFFLFWISFRTEDKSFEPAIRQAGKGKAPAFADVHPTLLRRQDRPVRYVLATETVL